MKHPALTLLLVAAACGASAELGEDAAPSSDVTPEADAAADLVRIGDIDWHTDYDVAAAEAVLRDRPLLLHFGENPG
jgi:hypothetical protein